MKRAIYRPGAPCYVRIRGVGGTDWMLAVIVCAEPLTAEVVADHPVWKGCPVTRSDALIRVDPRLWPRAAKTPAGHKSGRAQSW